MSTLLCLGYGYSARHYVAKFGGRFAAIIGTVRDDTRASRPQPCSAGGHSVTLTPFDGVRVSPQAIAAVEKADALLVSVPPDANGDPALRLLSDAISSAGRVSSIVYLSTIGVYGDQGGAFVDEATPPTPMSARSRARLAAENAWISLGERAQASVAILRLAGIYGPGQNALHQVARGTARRIVKPGQVFNRIHVADIAQAIDAVFARKVSGIFNVSDDEPAPAQDVISFAADLLCVAPPAAISFAEAEVTMTEMAKSFYAECKRARNDRLKRDLDVTLRYPTYREGLRSLFAAGDHLRSSS